MEVLPPVLELTVDRIEIYQNEEINYDSYIKVAKDKEDGDLKDKVEYNKIDTSVVGEYEVKYSLENSSHKKVEKTMKVKVNEVVQVQEPQEPEPTPTQDTNTSNNQNNTSGSTSTSQIQLHQILIINLIQQVKKMKVVVQTIHQHLEQEIFYLVMDMI